MKAKTKLDKVNTFLTIVLIAAVCFLAACIIFNLFDKSGKQDGEATIAEDVSVIDPFTAGTYGGVEFKSEEDVVNYYAQCYNYTKTLTANYTDGGTPVTYYKLLGTESLDIQNLLIEGSSNSMIDSLVPGIVGGLFTGGAKGLPPNSEKNPESDERDLTTGEHIKLTECLLTADDVLAANVTDNGDGTITLVIQPKSVLTSCPGEDAQGRFFNTLGDISSTVESISVLSFSEGTIEENFVVNYQAGTGTITIDTSTGEIVAAEYEMKVHIDVKHACVTVLKDKSASLDIVYSQSFPASDEYLSTVGLARA